MAKTGFIFDIDGLKKQLERVKIQIEVGATEGMYQGKDIMVDIMKVMMDITVYQAYTPDPTNPKSYQRTMDLLNSITAVVDDGTLYVYVDDSDLDKPDGSRSYAYRVLLGDDEYPYDHPVEGAGFMHERNWVEATKAEIISMTNQSQKFLHVVRNAIQKRL